MHTHIQIYVYMYVSMCMYLWYIQYLYKIPIPCYICSSFSACNRFYHSRKSSHCVCYINVIIKQRQSSLKQKQTSYLNSNKLHSTTAFTSEIYNNITKVLFCVNKTSEGDCQSVTVYSHIT